MATKLTLQSILGAVKHTLCHNLDLEKVGSILTEEGKISTYLAKYVKKAMRKKDNKLNAFFSVLTKFDLKSFVVFLEVLDAISDEKHRIILNVLCHDLQHLSLQSEADEGVVARLQSMVVKYCPSSPAASAVGVEERKSSAHKQDSPWVGEFSSAVHHERIQGLTVLHTSTHLSDMSMPEECWEPLVGQSPAIQVISHGERQLTPSILTPAQDEGTSSSLSTPLQGEGSVPSTPLQGEGSPPSTPLQGESSSLSTTLQGEGSSPSTPLQGEGPAPTTTLQGEGLSPSTPLQGEGSSPSTPLQGEGPAPTTPLQGEGLAPSTSLKRVVLYYNHPIEKFSFNRINQDVFYSPIHDVTVRVGPEAFPKHLNEFEVSLIVNDYSQPITMLPQYTGVYSALINLKCEPHFDKFQDHVRVTLPHCAIGDIDSLCVLSAGDDDNELVEDPDIEIESIDEDYITFKTTHFSKYRGTKGKASHRHRAGVGARTSSLSEPTKHSPVQSGVRRHYPCPTAGDSGITDVKFCAAMFRPRDTSSSSHWQFTVILTYNLPTYSEELETHASRILNTTTTRNLVPAMAPFTFVHNPIELSPSRYSVSGWTVYSQSPPAIAREGIEQYWSMPPDERKSAELFVPYIMYEVSKDNATSSRYCTIKLNGSQSLLEHKPVSFQVPLRYEPQPHPAPEPKTIKIIKIIHEMYRTSPNHAPILEGVSGEHDCSQILLCTGDINCHTLLCEISFNMDQWEDLGRHLGMGRKDIQVIKRQYQWKSLFEAAFQMLMKWIVGTCTTPNLGMLIEGLRSIGTTIVPSSWTAVWSCRLKSMDEIFFAKLAKAIPCYWEFIARLLGISETDICQAVGRSERDICGQAYEMLWEWKRQQIENMDTYTELVNAVHCVKQHTCDLDDAVKLLTTEL